MSTTRMLNEKFAGSEYKAEDKRTPLEKHIDYCGGGITGDYISYTSMVDRNKKLGEGSCKAISTAAKVSFGAGMIVKHCPFRQFTAKEAVGKLNHSHHTGIYNLDGTINETIWNALSPYAVKDKSDTRILTKERFYDFLNARRQEENSSNLMGKLASNGEWESYWQKFSTTNEFGMEYVTLKNLRDFFEDSSKPGREVEQRVSNHR